MNIENEKERSLINKRVLTVTMLLMVFVFVFGMSVNAAEFEDTNHWAKNSIDYVADQGYFIGTSATKFSPEMSMTRGMFVTVLSRLEGIDANQYNRQVFSDVAPGEYYFSAVCWGYETGIVAGKGNGKFEPSSLITREEICQLLSQYVDVKGISPINPREKTIYADDALIADWSRNAVYKMQVYRFLIGGPDNTFRPQDNATRAECACVVARTCGQFLENFDAEEMNPPVEVGPDKTYLGSFTNTFYCAGSCCNGKWAGMTATGAPPIPGVTIAVDKTVIPLGSKVYIEFVDERAQVLNGVYIAQDVGGGIKGNQIDVLVETHALANYYGVCSAHVYLINE